VRRYGQRVVLKGEVMAEAKAALLTAGGLAPCLSAAVGALIHRYTEIAPDIELIGYRNGYSGLLTGRSIAITPQVRQQAHILYEHGGSPLGNSRVSLKNTADCVKRGLIDKDDDPFTVASEQLRRDKISILHTIGGDDTNTTAAELAAYLKQKQHGLTVVGLPKTIDNDIRPIRQSLGALTAAEQGALFFANIVNEQSTARRMLIIHEVMGRHSGWLAAKTAQSWRSRLGKLAYLEQINVSRPLFEIDAIYLPEMHIDMVAEGQRLKAQMDRKDCVNLFISEGAYAKEIVDEKVKAGETVRRDAFGHVRLDEIDTGAWFAKKLGPLIGAAKVLVQKSGYFARSAAANAEDLSLIKEMAGHAVESALQGRSGVVGHDEEKNGILSTIEFSRITGSKPFDLKTDWFRKMLAEIGQPGN
jgi:pyrophosphate--fructose-6-phosphate 1-phosphotransferase